jgi:CRP-like cAMP-binding protein
MCTVIGMVNVEFLDPTSAEQTVLPIATVLVRRGVASAWAVHLDAGRVVLGVQHLNDMVHQLGNAEGPLWLNASEVALNLGAVVDMVAQTEVRVRRIPAAKFRQSLAELPQAARWVIRDMATAHRQQVELSVSRLALDADARCAEWLLQHAQPEAQGQLSVTLQQPKRMIAAQLGIAPETFSRVLQHLRLQGLISGSGRQLWVMDLVGLQKMVSG